MTPRIRPSSEADGWSPALEEQRRREREAKRITKLTGAKLEGEELLQQLEHKKRMVGPGLDRSGCTLVTESRRRGFYDDEDFEEEIEPDDVESDGA